MAAAINNIKERLFEATSVDNKVVVIAKVAGPRFNDLIIGRDIFMTGPQTSLITNVPAFVHPDFIFINSMEELTILQVKL